MKMKNVLNLLAAAYENLKTLTVTGPENAKKLSDAAIMIAQGYAEIERQLAERAENTEKPKEDGHAEDHA